MNLNFVINLPLILGIYGYRTFLSPRKGYRCACGATTGKSCSDAGLDLFKKHNAVTAFQLLSVQFKKCSKIATSLKSQKGVFFAGCYDESERKWNRDRKAERDGPMKDGPN